MGERKSVPVKAVKAVKAVAAACQEAIDTVVEPVDEAMRVKPPGACSRELPMEGKTPSAPSLTVGAR